MGVTVFITTHYLEEAEYCHRIMLIHGGRLIAGGSPQDLKMTVIRHPILEVECDRTGRALALLQAQEWVAAATIFGARLRVHVGDEAEGRQKMAIFFREHGIALKHMERVGARLEDVFIRLIEAEEEAGN